MLKTQVTCLNGLAVLADRRGDQERGLQLHRESLNMLRQIGGQRNEATALVNVGAKLVGFGDLAGARRDLEEGLRLSRQNGDRALECAASCNLSMLALWEGDDARALATARSALDTAMSMQARDLEVAASLFLGHAEEALGRLGPAAQAFAHSHRVALEIGSSGSSLEANVRLASVAVAQGNRCGAGCCTSAPVAARAVEGSGASDAMAGHCEPAVADAAAANCDPALSPALRLDVYLVLMAAGDPRAAAWLHSAYRTLMTQANAISDVATVERCSSTTSRPTARSSRCGWPRGDGRNRANRSFAEDVPSALGRQCQLVTFGCSRSAPKLSR